MSFCAYTYCAFFRTYFRMHRYFVLGFSCALFLTFFIVSWGNKWVRLFACFDFAFCIVWAHPHCLVCRWVFCLLDCFLVLYMHLRACIIFSSDFMVCLIVFFCQITHICISCFPAGCCRCRFLNFSNFLSTHFRFCCLHRLFIMFALLLDSRFTCSSFSWYFFWLVSCLLFLLCKLAG